MAEKKVISIRFHMDNKEDWAIYKCIKEEAGTSASLAFVVKSIIRNFYNKEKENTDLQESLALVIKKEIQGVGIQLIGSIISSMSKLNNDTIKQFECSKDNLPEKCEELPIGALDFLK